MKIRKGLVSNSSSSSFILDGRNPRAQKLLSKCIAGYIDPYNLSRRTGQAEGTNAVEWAKNWLEDMGDCYKKPNGIGHIILKYAAEIGEENIIFLMESDEGMGGSLFEESLEGNCYSRTGLYEELNELAIAEIEYH